VAGLCPAPGNKLVRIVALGDLLKDNGRPNRSSLHVRIAKQSKIAEQIVAHQCEIPSDRAAPMVTDHDRALLVERIHQSDDIADQIQDLFRNVVVGAGPYMREQERKPSASFVVNILRDTFRADAIEFDQLVSNVPRVRSKRPLLSIPRMATVFTQPRLRV
jgi:hypothetical protein